MAEENISVPYVQTEENYILIPHSQDIDIFSIGSNLESIAISYSDNQFTDSDL